MAFPPCELRRLVSSLQLELSFSISRMLEVERQPFCLCDASSAVYRQLTAVKFIQELQISIATTTVEICQTFSSLRIIVTTSKTSSETIIICSRSFVCLGKEKYQEIFFCWLLTKPVMFELQEIKSKHFLSVVFMV